MDLELQYDDRLPKEFKEYIPGIEVPDGLIWIIIKANNFDELNPKFNKKLTFNNLKNFKLVEEVFTKYQNYFKKYFHEDHIKKYNCVFNFNIGEFVIIKK